MEGKKNPKTPSQETPWIQAKGVEPRYLPSSFR